MFERIKSLFGLETEPDWKQNPEHYYVCPSCEHVAVNATWETRDKKKDKVLFVDHRGIEHHDRELQQQCPECDEWIPFNDVDSLAEIAAFERKTNSRNT